jgi:hypothetical protein
MLISFPRQLVHTNAAEKVFSIRVTNAGEKNVDSHCVSSCCTGSNATQWARSRPMQVFTTRHKLDCVTT